MKIQGGLLEAITREVEIECLPDEIPESFTVDVTELMIGQNLRASDIPLSGSMKLLSAPEQVIAHVVTMKAEEVVAPTAEAGAEVAAPAEPEVIKKGKKEEEGASRGGEAGGEGKGEEEVRSGGRRQEAGLQRSSRADRVVCRLPPVACRLTDGRVRKAGSGSRQSGRRLRSNSPQPGVSGGGPVGGAEWD